MMYKTQQILLLHLMVGYGRTCNIRGYPFRGLGLETLFQ